MPDAIHATLGDALDAIAERQPDAPLMHRPGRPAVTYGALGEQLRDVRVGLRDRGIGPGDVIAGFDASRATMAMACLALPASSTFAPLAPSLAAPAYEALLRRLRPRAVLVPREGGHALRAAASRVGVATMVATERADRSGVFSLDLDDRASAHSAPGALPSHAYVLVTSGTTGRPKLAPLGHRQMLDYAHAIVPWLRLAPDDVGYALAPFHFAGGLRASLLLSALAGASFVCLDEGDVDGFFRAIDTCRPTCLTAPFSIQRAIASRASAFPQAVAQARFRYLRSTAGRLDPAVAERLERIFRAPVLQGYGTTEVCGIAHDPLPPAPRKRGSVGVALGGEVRTMDADGRLLAPGEEGEIVVRGPLVFDGYLDDPELTARTFAGEWLRTGDLGVVDADGYVFVGSRLAETINCGGEKIAPAEIDAVVEAMPGVREAAACGLMRGTHNEVLALAVVAAPGATIGEQAIRERLRAELGERRVPRRIVFVDALPRTDAGKVMRNALADELGAESTHAPSPATRS
jgi:acyl-coenzyme A synthetase/AMP-(fatty) acid ligase